MSERSFIIRDLVSTEFLSTRLVAGARGVQRQVFWAHSCELPDPAQRLGYGELLMTTGFCVPHDPDEQRLFIADLDRAGLAGITISSSGTSPVISELMTAEANRRGFPLLTTATAATFGSISRTVAVANTDTHTKQMLLLSKLYHVIADRQRTYEDLFRGIEQAFRVRLRLVETSTGSILFDGMRDVDKSNTLDGDIRVRRYPLTGRYPATLMLMERPGRMLDSFSLVHLLKVLSVEVAAVLGAARRRAAQSRQQFDHLLSNANVSQAWAVITREHEAEWAEYRVIATPVETSEHLELSLALESIIALSRADDTTHLTLIPSAMSQRFRSLLDWMGISAGVSSSFTDPRDVQTAVSEAGAALSALRETAQPTSSVGTARSFRNNNIAVLSGGEASWIEYAGMSLSLLTRSHNEAENVIREVFGPLAADTEKAQMLRRTLYTFLSRNRQLTTTAAVLGIHRHTLTYRLKQVEELTGRNPAHTASLTELWLACEAWQLTGRNF